MTTEVVEVTTSEPPLTARDLNLTILNESYDDDICLLIIDPQVITLLLVILFVIICACREEIIMPCTNRTTSMVEVH